MGKTKKIKEEKKMIRKMSAIFVLLVVTVLFTYSQLYAAKELVVCTYGGKWGENLQETLIKPFEEKYGVKVVQALNPKEAKIKAMVLTKNVEWDVVEISSARKLRLQNEGLLEKLDYSYFDSETLSGFEDYQKSPYSIVIAYDKDVFPKEHPKSWADFWDVKKFPGPRCLKSGGGSGHGPIEEALLADGVPKDKLYPCDLERAYKSLKKIRPHVVKWWETGAVAPQLLVDKEVVMTSAYHGRIDKIKRAGANVDWSWGEGKLNRDEWLIPKGTENFDLAMKFIAFCSHADQQAAMCKNYPNGAVNKHAYKQLSAQRAKELPSSPENAAMQFNIDYEWWASINPKTGRTWHETAKEMWDAWILE